MYVFSFSLHLFSGAAAGLAIGFLIIGEGLAVLAQVIVQD